MYIISDEVMKFIGKKNMTIWRVELTASGKVLAEEKIKRVLFQ